MARIVRGYPLLIDRIHAQFGVRGKPVIYAWGDIIYNPMGIVIPPELLVHEAVHCERQGIDPVSWWEQYLDDELFRLDEEVLAHRAEYEFLTHTGNRAMRRGAAAAVAGRLASPLYGRMISKADAVRALVNG